MAFLVATGNDVDVFLQRAADRRIDVDKSPALGRLGSTAVVTLHGDITKFIGDAEPGSHQADLNEAALVTALTRGLSVTQDHSRTATTDR